jgi:regulator of nucleoside diphosphate kinase
MSATQTQKLIITDVDLARLQPVIDQHAEAGAQLEDELTRAQIVAQAAVPRDVVTMNSTVVYEDSATGTRRTVTVVFPRDADPASGRISILAPIGTALLGMSAGQSLTWRLPNRRTTTVRVLDVTYQPEAAGDLNR